MKHKSILKHKGLYYSTVLVQNVIRAFCKNIILAFIIKYVTNAVVEHKIQYFYTACKLALFSFVVCLTIEPLINRINEVEVKHSLARLRENVFQKVCHGNIKEMEKIGTADVITRLTYDVDTLERLYHEYIPQLVFSIIFGIMAISNMFRENWMIALVSIIIGMTSVLVANLLSKKVEENAKKYSAAKSDMAKQIVDMRDGLFDIKVNVCEEYFVQRFKHVNQLVRRLYQKRELQMNGLEIAALLFQDLNEIGVIILGLYFVLQGYITVGSVLAILRLNGNASFFFQTINSFIGGVKNCKPSYERVVELLEIPQEAHVASKVNPDNSEQGINLEKVSFSYDNEKNVLNQVTMKIKKGKFISLEGESGSGKSTLLKLLLGFYSHTDGKIKMGEYDLSLQDRRSLISYVPQNYYLYQMSVFDNVRLGKLDATIEEVMEACKLAGAHDFIQNLEQGYDTMIMANGTNLSGGQCQRIAIARALLRNTPFLVLDEATAALDPESELHIKNILHKLKENKGILCISHRKAMIENADIRYYLDHGILC